MDLCKIRRELLGVIVEVEGAIDETDSERVIPVELTQGEIEMLDDIIHVAAGGLWLPHKWRYDYFTG